MTESKHQIDDAEYAAALAAGRVEADTEIRAETVRYLPDRDALEIVTTRGAGFVIPRSWIGAIDEVSPEELSQISVWPDGSAIELESRDVHINVHGLMTAVLPAMLPTRALASIFASRGGSATTAAKRRSAKANGRRGGRPSLHGEIVAVLKERGSMGAPDIARAINRRDRYHKRDGTKVDRGQVDARVTRYPQLFERRGGQVRLRPGV
jgi:hypothetical protein